ncbi:MAG: rRNA pseudouridine synthase [Phycisphaerae bacterium]|nr:rRNA pseudouridine synthase [Phycisphaerae bacterium]
MATERIQKVLAAAGFGARRAGELLVLDGRVAVNGRTVRTLPVLVDPDKDRITVDGKPVRPEGLAYYLLNKPRHVFCTHNDPAGRKLAVDLLVGVRERVFPVGRLDAESTGLLIMTNDGALAQKLTHPRFGIPKTYRVEVAGCPTTKTLQRLRAGTWLADGKTAPAMISVTHRQRDKAIMEITLREGRNREIRRMLAKAGHKVRRLARVRMGKLSIRKLPLGAFRRLTPDEVQYLRSLAERFSTQGATRRPARSRPAAPREPATEPRPRRAPAGRSKTTRRSSSPPKANAKPWSKKETGGPPRPPARRRILAPDGP